MIACVLPARLNSSRFPGKLLALVEGKTILQRSYESALRAESIDQLFVATDHPQIADHVQSFGGSVIWTSSNCISGTERVAEALQKEPKLQQATILINLQADHPLTSPTTLNRITALLLENPSTEVATAVRPLRSWDEYHSPHAVKCVMDHSYNALFFSRAPIPYQKECGNLPSGYLHIGIYGFQISFFQKLATLPNSGLQRCEDLEQLRLLEMGIGIKIALVEDDALGIDTPEDLEKLKKILCSRI